MNDQSTPRRSDLAKQFGYDSWPPGGGQSFQLSQLEFAEGDVPGYRPHRVVSPPTPPGVVAARESVWIDAAKPAEDDAILLVDVYECATDEAARSMLLNLLGQVQSTQTVRVDGIGEVAFSPGDGAVFFVRGNLAVRVLAGGPAAEPVGDRAQSIDDVIRGRSPNRRPGKTP